MDYDLKAAIWKMIDDRDNVSFAELSRLPGFEGNISMQSSDLGIVYWSGLSDAAVDAIASLMNDGRIEMASTTTLIYAIDGMMLSLPVAKQARRYKKPRWLPVVFKKAKCKTRPEGRDAERNAFHDHNGREWHN